MSVHQIVADLEEKIKTLPNSDLSFQVYDVEEKRESKIHRFVHESIHHLPAAEKKRVIDELFGLGPIESLILDKNITEIIINGPKSIWYELNGQLQKLDDSFSTELRFSQFIFRLCQKGNTQFTLNRPMADGKFGPFRLHFVSEEITKGGACISLRRHPENPWNFSRLAEASWASAENIKLLEEMISARKSFMVIGGTGSGKTSFLNACLQSLRKNERAIVIEDTPELELPNDLCCKLVARQDAQGALDPISQTELVKQSLRMRPDRLVLGEIRGGEARDFLMALSTGHEGSFGSLHAQDPQQALLRLEMLIQLGASAWSLDAIRNLIFLSLRYIVAIEKDCDGKRKLNGIYRLSSRESSGILVDRIA